MEMLQSSSRMCRELNLYFGRTDCHINVNVNLLVCQCEHVSTLLCLQKMVKTTNHDADAQSNAPLDAGSSCSVGWDLSFGARGQLSPHRPQYGAWDGSCHCQGAPEQGTDSLAARGGLLCGSHFLFLHATLNFMSVFQACV